MAPEAGLSCCQPHSVEWHSSRSRQAALFFCQFGQWSGEVTAVTRLCRLRSARQDKVSVDPCIKCSCDTVGWRGDLAKVASP
jgi:hypothetical protein